MASTLTADSTPLKWEQGTLIAKIVENFEWVRRGTTEGYAESLGAVMVFSEGDEEPVMLENFGDEIDQECLFNDLDRASYKFLKEFLSPEGTFRTHTKVGMVVTNSPTAYLWNNLGNHLLRDLIAHKGTGSLFGKREEVSPIPITGDLLIKFKDWYRVKVYSDPKLVEVVNREGSGLNILKEVQKEFESLRAKFDDFKLILDTLKVDKLGLALLEEAISENEEFTEEVGANIWSRYLAYYRKAYRKTDIEKLGTPDSLLFERFKTIIYVLIEKTFYDRSQVL